MAVVQPLALFCGLLAVLNVDATGSTLNWLIGAVFLQLIVLTLLIIHWQR